MYTLGIDSSTQGVKALVYDTAAQKAVATVSVSFGKDLPEFGCPDGFLPNDDVLVRQSDPLMWLAALDLLLSRLGDAFDTSSIAAIGGDGQQHGSVYLNSAWGDALAALGRAWDGRNGLRDIFGGALSRKVAPIWMDSSTTAQCRALDERFGKALQLRTGSPAIERFTGPQIMKFAAEDPAAWEETRRVHLVSSFLCSVLSGTDAPIDTGDGAVRQIAVTPAGRPEVSRVYPELMLVNCTVVVPLYPVPDRSRVRAEGVNSTAWFRVFLSLAIWRSSSAHSKTCSYPNLARI